MLACSRVHIGVDTRRANVDGRLFHPTPPRGFGELPRSRYTIAIAFTAHLSSCAESLSPAVPQRRAIPGLLGALLIRDPAPFG